MNYLYWTKDGKFEPVQNSIKFIKERGVFINEIQVVESPQEKFDCRLVIRYRDETEYRCDFMDRVVLADVLCNIKILNNWRVCWFGENKIITKEKIQ